MSLNESSWNATVFGIALTFMIGLHNAFSFGEKAEFYRFITTESENLLSALKFGDTDFNEILRKFIVLRESAAKSVPRGWDGDPQGFVYGLAITSISANFAVFDISFNYILAPELGICDLHRYKKQFFFSPPRHFIARSSTNCENTS
jgi:hypothetical protein